MGLDKEESVSVHREPLETTSANSSDIKERVPPNESETTRSSQPSGHRKRSSRKHSSASKARMTESDSEILDSVLSVLETTLSQSNTDAQVLSRRHVKRSASAMSSAMLQSGGYFVDEHGDLQQGTSRAASSSRPRSYSASRAGCCDSGIADHLRLSVLPEEGHKKHKHDSLVPSVAFKAPTQPPKFTNFLRAHHAVPFDMHACKISQSRTARPGPIATGGIASPADIKQLLSRESLQEIKLKNDAAQRSVLSVSAEHTHIPERSSSSRHATRPTVKEFNTQSVRAVKPVPLAQICNRPVKATDSTLRSASTSSFLTQQSGSSSSLHEQQSFTTEETAILHSNQTVQLPKQPHSGKLVFKGLKLLKPAKATESGPQMHVQQAEFSEHSARISRADTTDIAGMESFSESSFVDADIIQVPVPPPRKSTEAIDPATAESNTLKAEACERAEAHLSNSNLITFSHSQKPAENYVVESGSAQFQVLAKEIGVEGAFDLLRKEFITLGVRLAQLANRRSYVESALNNYESFTSDGNADHSYLTAEIEETQRKLDAIEDEMTQILARRADLRQHFADAGVNIQTEVISERQARKAKIDQALLLELNPLEAAQSVKGNSCAETLNATWLTGNQAASIADSCDHSIFMCDESLRTSLQGTSKPNVPRPQLPMNLSISVKDMAVGASMQVALDDSAVMGARVAQEDQPSNSIEVGLQVAESVTVQRVSASDTIDHISRIISPQYVDTERRNMSRLMAVLLTAFENPSDASVYAEENILKYSTAISNLGSSNSDASMKAALPALIRPYSDVIVLLMEGLSSFLHTGRSTALIRAVVASRKHPGWMCSPVLKVLASVLEILSLHVATYDTTAGCLDNHYFRAVHSGGAWIVSELIVFLRCSLQSMNVISVDDAHQIMAAILTFSSRVSSEVSQRWRKELHAIVSAEPQLQRYRDLQEALPRGKESNDGVAIEQR